MKRAQLNTPYSYAGVKAGKEISRMLREIIV